VFLYVSRDNPAAIKVYTKTGFKKTGHKYLGFYSEEKKWKKMNGDIPCFAFIGVLAGGN